MKNLWATNAQWVFLFISSSSRSKQLTSRSRVCRVVESLILTSGRDIPLQSRRAKVYTSPRIVSVVQSWTRQILPLWAQMLPLAENIATHSASWARPILPLWIPMWVQDQQAMMPHTRNIHYVWVLHFEHTNIGVRLAPIDRSRRVRDRCISAMPPHHAYTSNFPWRSGLAIYTPVCMSATQCAVCWQVCGSMATAFGLCCATGQHCGRQRCLQRQQQIIVCVVCVATSLDT